MNDELKNEITKLLSGILENTSKAGDFLAGELPEYLSQLVFWYGTYNLILFVIGIILLSIAITIDVKLGAKLYRQAKDPWFSEKFVMGYLVAGTLIRFFVYLTILIKFINLTWLQVYLAPKVWLVEYVAGLGS